MGVGLAHGVSFSILLTVPKVTYYRRRPVVWFAPYKGAYLQSAKCFSYLPQNNFWFGVLLVYPQLHGFLYTPAP